MTDIEKAYLKYNGYSDLEIENWEEEGEFDIQKEQSYKDFVKVFKLGQSNAISLYEDEMNNMNSDYCNRIKKLQIENAGLKEQVEKMKSLINKTCSVCKNKKCHNAGSDNEYLWHKEGDFICNDRDKWEFGE